MMRITPVTRFLLLVNILVFFFMSSSLSTLVPLFDFQDLEDMLGLHFFLAPHFRFYQLFTYMFVHAGFTHILFNMFGLWMFGPILERVWGGRRFLFYYLSCGLGAGLFQEAAQLVQFYAIMSSQVPHFALSNLLFYAQEAGAALNTWTTVGASGSIFGVLLGFGMLFPNERMFIIPFPFPIKAKYLVGGYAAVELLQALFMTGDNVAHLAHIGGMVIGFFMIRYWQKHPTQGHQSYGNGHSLFGQWKQKMENNGGTNRWGWPTHSSQNSAMGDRKADWDDNERQRKAQEEIDQILDKIRKSGYNSLSADEKRRLFEQSNRS